MVAERRPAVVPPAAASFGERLRAARERRGLTLRQIADTTKMSVTTLEAIEHDDLRRLPGGIFSRSFVRSFAAEVGLDPEESLREFERAFPEHAPRPELVTPESVEPMPRESRRLWPWVLVGALILGGLGVAAFARFGWLPFSASSEPVPAPEAIAEPAAGSPAAAVPPDGARESVGESTESAAPAPRADAPALPPVLMPPPPSTPPPAATPATVVGSASAGALRLAIEPRTECWVELRGDGRVLVSRLLRPGERIEAGADEAFQIAVGDAGALTYTINGQAGRSLGRAGQVVRARIDRATLADFLAR